MGVVDRTDEFRHILREAAAKSGGGLSFEATPQATSELNRWSAEIGGEIHETSQKVGELRKMSKQKGIFNDKTNQIQVLTHTVKQQIQLLNQKIEALESKAKSSGKNKSYQAHASTLVETLKTRLLQVTKEFKDALEDRTKALEQQDARRQIYSSGAGSAANPFAGRGQPVPSGNADDPEAGGGRAMSMQQGYHSSRAEAVQSVQKTIGELAQMFQKMAVMVTAQEEMIQRIDHDVDDARDNAEKAQENLLQYFRYISSNRALIIKVFLILIFFVVFFVVFLA